LKYSGKTDIGLKRKNNQDSFTVISRANFLSAVVCDGMGGAKGGNVASTFATKAYSCIIKTVFGKITPETNISDDEIIQNITSAVDKANEVVYDTASNDVELEGMGTTLVSVLIFGGKAYVANVGDSRLYAMKDGVLKQITNDHSFVQF
jgi:protein phosphatase